MTLYIILLKKKKNKKKRMLVEFRSLKNKKLTKNRKKLKLNKRVFHWSGIWGV